MIPEIGSHFSLTGLPRNRASAAAARVHRLRRTPIVPKITDPRGPSLRLTSPLVCLLSTSPPLRSALPPVAHPLHRCRAAAVPTHGICGGAAGRLPLPTAVSLPRQPDAQLPPAPASPKLDDAVGFVSPGRGQRRGRGRGWPPSLANPTPNYLGAAPLCPEIRLDDAVGFISPERGQRQGRGCGADLYGRLQGLTMSTGPSAGAILCPPSAKPILEDHILHVLDNFAI